MDKLIPDNDLIDLARQIITKDLQDHDREERDATRLLNVLVRHPHIQQAINGSLQIIAEGRPANAIIAAVMFGYALRDAIARAVAQAN